MTPWRYALGDRVSLTGDYTTQEVAAWRVIARSLREDLRHGTTIAYTVEPWELSGDWALDRRIAWVPEQALIPGDDEHGATS